MLEYIFVKELGGGGRRGTGEEMPFLNEGDLCPSAYNLCIKPCTDYRKSTFFSANWATGQLGE